MKLGGVVAAGLSLVSIQPMHVAHADEDPVTFLNLEYQGDCDKENRHLWIENSHSTKSILATIRWHLAKSTRVVSDQFQIGPAQRLEIGCAAQSDIASAQFVP